MGKGLSGGCIGSSVDSGQRHDAVLDRQQGGQQRQPRKARAFSQTTAAAEDDEVRRDGRLRGGAGGWRHDRGQGLRWKGG